MDCVLKGLRRNTTEEHPPKNSLTEILIVKLFDFAPHPNDIWGLRNNEKIRHKARKS